MKASGPAICYYCSHTGTLASLTVHRLQVCIGLVVSSRLPVTVPVQKILLPQMAARGGFDIIGNSAVSYYADITSSLSCSCRSLSTTGSPSSACQSQGCMCLSAGRVFEFKHVSKGKQRIV